MATTKQLSEVAKAKEAEEKARAELNEALGEIEPGSVTTEQLQAVKAAGTKFASARDALRAAEAAMEAAVPVKEEAKDADDAMIEAIANINVGTASAEDIAALKGSKSAPAPQPQPHPAKAKA